MTTRADIVSVAREYLGTPFHHRGRTPGVALDCAGVVICAARELGIFAPQFDVTNYTGSPDGTMMLLCDQYMTRILKSEMESGDVVALITDKDGTREQHLGILADYRHGGLSLIHASNDRLHKAVIETRLMFSRNFRFAGAWRFPGID